MNKLLTTAVTLALSFTILFATNKSSLAQDLEEVNLVTNPGDITVAAGLTRGTSTGFLGNAELGLTGQLLYTVNEDIRAGLDFTYYLIGERQLSANELNFNIHMFVRNRNNLTLYGLSGINISNTSGSDEIWRVQRELGNPDTRRYGLNLGAGLEVRLGNIVLYGEPKLTLLGWNQLAITGGFRYIL